MMAGPYAPRFIAPDADVLIVDDTPMNLVVAKELLKSTRVFVSTAESGEECLEKIKYGNFNIVFLDHTMPGMDGVETLERIRKTVISPSEKLNEILRLHNTSEVSTGIRLIELLKRPELSYDILKEIDTTRPELNRNILEQIEIEIKYEGYIKRQLIIIEQVRKLEKKILPDDIDYAKIDGLSLEAREKLNKVRPGNIGQASRISGVSPADISVLVIYLASLRNKENKNADTDT